MAIQTWNRNWAAGVETSFWLASYSLFAQGVNRGAPDVYGPQAQVWQCSISVGEMKRRTDDGGWQKIGSFFTRAAGQSGKIRMFDPKRIRPGRDIERQAGGAAFDDGTYFTDGTGFSDTDLPGYCTVYEAAPALADSIVVTGLPPSLSPCFWAGDRFEHLPNGAPRDYSLYYEIAFDAPTDSAGRTRIYISPGLRLAVAAGDQIKLSYPTALMRLTSEDQGIIEHSGGGIGRTAFQMIEILSS